MAIELITKYLPYVDELFTTESKTQYLTNRDFDWVNAHAIKVYSVTTGDMYDYGRTGDPVTTGSFRSRYGEVQPLEATTQLMTLRKDRSFTYEIDALDVDETAGAVEAASSLARQLREVVIPEVDRYVISQMIANAGTSAYLQPQGTLYDEITNAGMVLDNSEVPEDGRVLVLTPKSWQELKQLDILNGTDTGVQARLSGVIGHLDGMRIIRVPAARVPDKFRFMVCHPMATVFAQKLASYNIHTNPPGINGSLIEGRICYDAFVLNGKRKAIYVQYEGAEPDDDNNG